MNQPIKRQASALTVWINFLWSVFVIPMIMSSCHGQQSDKGAEKTTPTDTLLPDDTALQLGQELDGIFEDAAHQIWFSSNGNGLYRYDGKTLINYTVKHGLISNYVWGIQQDINGWYWIVTRDGICRFDGKQFTDYTAIINTAPQGNLHYSKGNLFFNLTDGMCYYDGSRFTRFVIHPSNYQPPQNNMYRPYGVYCSLADKAGNVWFGTQEKGVCQWDGSSFKFITDNHLSGPAVRSIFQDNKGNWWFGNNGAGLFKYDGHTVINLTEKFNLGNHEFLFEKKLVDKPGSLARVFTINQDVEGNLWAGTADAGVWKYDGVTLTNYTTKDGLAGNSVTVIFKDHTGKLWFVVDGKHIQHFDYKTFYPATL